MDVTERRRAQELEHELDSERAQNLRLRATDEAKTTFQAVSHDLRTPLAAILGLAVTLESRQDMSGPTRCGTWPPDRAERDASSTGW